MTFEPALVSYLEGHVGLAAKVADRIYPGKIPQGGAVPAVAYQRISGTRFPAHDGPGGLSRGRYQFSCWAAAGEDGGGGYLEATEVAEQLRIALDGFAGTMGSPAVRVDAALVANDFDNYEADTRRYRRLVDVMIWHEETTT